MDGKCPPVTNQHQALKVALKKGDSLEISKAVKSLVKEIEANEAKLRAFAGPVTQTMIQLLPVVLACVQGVPSEQARLHSEGAVLLVELPDVPQLLEAYRKAPLVQMIGDEAVRGTVLDLLDAFDVDLGDAVEKGLTDMGVPGELAADPAGAAMSRLRKVEAISFSTSSHPERVAELKDYIGKRLFAMGDLRELSAHVGEHVEQNGVPDSLAALDLGELSGKDPWGREYLVRGTEDGGFELYSLGADGAEGGVGPDRDFTTKQDLGSYFKSEFPRLLGVQFNVRFTDAEAAGEAMGLLLKAAQEHGHETSNPQEFSLAGATAQLVRTKIERAKGVELWMLASDRHLAFGTGIETPESFAARCADAATPCAGTSFYDATLQKLPDPQGVTLVRAGMASARFAHELAQHPDGEHRGHRRAQAQSGSGRGAYRLGRRTLRDRRRRRSRPRR